MNLLFCIKSMSLSGGGAERVLATVTAGLAERGHEVTLLTFDGQGQPTFYPVQEKIRRIGIGRGVASAPSGLGLTLSRMAKLRAQAKVIAPYAAIGFMHSMYIPLAFALAGSGIPVIASEHIVYDHYRNLPVQRLLLLASAPLIQRVTCVSEQARSTYPTSLREHMVVIPNPAGPAVTGKAKVAKPLNGRMVLLTVGRLEAQKDHRTLIDAFARILPEVPQWDLRVVGEGSLRPELEAQVAALSLQDRVLFPGSVSGIATEYSAAHLFVMPSRYESYGLATAEALTCGLPAVGFADCPGTNSLIEHGTNGLLAPAAADRAVTLAHALLTAMRDDALRVQLARNASSRTQGARPADVVERWEELIDGGPAGPPPEQQVSGR